MPNLVKNQGLSTNFMVCFSQDNLNTFGMLNYFAPKKRVKMRIPRGLLAKYRLQTGGGSNNYKQKSGDFLHYELSNENFSTIMLFL